MQNFFHLGGDAVSSRFSVSKFSIILFFIFGLGCNSYSPKSSSGPTTAEMASPGFDTVQKYVFTPYCVTCHGTSGGNRAGFNFETYNNTVPALDKILEEAVTTQGMPPAAPLPAKLRQLVDTWIKSGAPLSGQNPVPHPPIQPAPYPPFGITARWSSISGLFKQPVCADCHNPDGDASKAPITDLTFLFKADDKGRFLVVPKDSSKSLLYKILKAGKMPKSRPLDPKDIQAIADWIDNGALDN